MKQAQAGLASRRRLVDRRNVVGRSSSASAASGPRPCLWIASRAMLICRKSGCRDRVEIRANDDVSKPPHEAVTVRCAVDRVDRRPLFLVRNQSSQYLQVRHADKKVAALAPSESKVAGFVDVDAPRALEVISPQSKDSVDVGCVSGPLSLSGLDARVALEDGARVLIINDGGEAFEEKDVAKKRVLEER